MIGETIGNFKIAERLGSGGMGDVFLAEQTNIGTKVAIKMLRREVSDDTEHVQRFFNEARAVSKIQHAGIVKIFDVGYTGDGQAYLIMEYLEGETLAKRISSRGHLDLAELTDLGKQIASVLGATHHAGITHRDLKPDNIYIVPDGELARGERVKVLDFGIAKLTGTLAGASPQTIGTMGTPAYMAPEQWGDASKVDWRADVYSLGCVAFEMATGRPPFVISTIAEACALHLHEVPVRASTLVAGIPAALDELLARLLEKTPEVRVQSMQELARTFEAIGEGRGSAIRAAQAAETRGTMDAVAAMGATLAPGTMPRGTLPPASVDGAPPARKKSRVALFALVGLGIAGAGGAATYLAVSGSDKPKHEKHEKVAVTPPPPVALHAPVATPPPPVPVDAPLVVAVPVDAAASPDAAPAHHPSPTAKPTIDRAAVDAAIKTAQSKLDGCAAATHGRGAAVSGTGNVKLTVELDGFATQIAGSGLDAYGNHCIENVVEKIAFPKPKGGAVPLDLPLAFAPSPIAEEPGGPRMEIRAELARFHGQLGDCAAKARFRGKMSVRVEVAADGSIQRAELMGAHSGTPLETCVQSVLVGQRLSKQGRAVTVTIPVTVFR